MQNDADSKAKTLVVVNPVAGTRKGKSLWSKIVEPRLKESGRFEIVEVLFTAHSGHAGELMHEVRDILPEINVIIALGGDGIVNEIYNGIFTSFAVNEEWRIILSHVTVAQIPCGTGNGLCYSTLCLAGVPFTLDSALDQLLRFQTTKRDLGLVTYTDPQSGKEVTKLFALTISWGLVADVDVGSESMRCFGDARFAMYGIFKILRKRLYSAKLVMDGEEKLGSSESLLSSKYVTFYASLVPVAGGTVILDPTKPMESGHFSVYSLGSSVTRMQLLKLMDELGKNRPHSSYIPWFTERKTKTFSLLPDPLQGKKSSTVVVDGERFTRGGISVSLLSGVTNCLVG